MKSIILSILAAFCLTFTAISATTTNNNTSLSKTFTTQEVKENFAYTISHTFTESQEWCGVEWTLTVYWSDGTSSEYSGVSYSPDGCGKAYGAAYRTMGVILEAVIA